MAPMRMRLPGLACAALIAGLPTLSAAAADGQAPLGPALEAGQKAGSKLLKGELLRRCKTLDEEIRELDTRLAVLQSTMDVYGKRLDRYDVELDAAKAALDDTDGEAVARYNREIEGQRAVSAKHDALLPEHNELVQRQNPRVAEFNAKCAGISYYRAEWLNTEVARDPALMPPATVF